MMSLAQNLYITYSNQKARDLKENANTQVFDKIITLDSFISELFEKIDMSNVIDDAIASAIIYKIIHEQNIAYFDYLKSDAVSLKTIYNFIVKCHRNEIAFSLMLEGEKLDALTRIDQHYQAYKKEYKLVDIADVEIMVASSFEISMLQGYKTIYLDSFIVGDISFIKSKKQNELLKKLSIAHAIAQIDQPLHVSKLVTPSNEVFDSIDEIKTAIKIARQLLLSGEDAKEILIVASDISEYAPLYKLFLDEYGIKGFSSKGTPLNHFYNTNDERVQNAYNSYKLQIEKISRLYARIGLSLDESVKEALKSSITILDEKIGIEITEPNQIVGLSRRYKHIIFVGTDINHFPPKAEDNFLYSYEDEIEYFYSNNYFTSSQTHLRELRRLCEKLYIITALYSGKRELSRSILIGNSFDESIDVSAIQSIGELAFHTQTVIMNEEQKNYFESLTCKDFTKYDGDGVEGITAKHLSASQINKYLSCPLAYLYANKVKLKAPKQSEEGFDVMEQGSLMHLCFELFGRAIKEQGNTSTDAQELYALMFTKSKEAYADEETQKNITEPNIHHQIFLSNLQAGLDDERPKGLLAKFVDYYIKHVEEFNYFKNSEFEKEFALDANLKPYDLTCKEDTNYFIKGFIDRFDALDGHINIIDYKSKKMSSNIDKAKQEQVETLKDVQLALYILYASQQHPEKEYKAHLLSFKGDNPYYHFANLSTLEDLKDTVHYNEAYNKQLKQIIYNTKANIEAGQFAFNNIDEKACGYCDIRFMCHEGILSKNKIVLKIKD